MSREPISSKSDGVQGEANIVHIFPSAEPTPYTFTIHLYLLLSNFSGAQKTILRRARTLRGREEMRNLSFGKRAEG